MNTIKYKMVATAAFTYGLLSREVNVVTEATLEIKLPDGVDPNDVLISASDKSVTAFDSRGRILNHIKG